MPVRILILAALLFVLPSPLRADEARLRCVADTNVSSYAAERDFNYGHSPRLRLKGIEMLALFQFDTAPVAGWKIERATLYLRYANADRELRTIGVSTIGAPWQEGTGEGEKKPGEVCFNWREQGRSRWAGPQTDLTDVTFTEGNSLAAYADARDAGDGWIAVPVEPKLVQALLAHVSYGLAVSDEKGQTHANNDIFAQEQSGSEPYLVVTGKPGDTQPPGSIKDAQITPDPKHATFDHGAATLTFTAPSRAFAYEIICSPQGSDVGSALPRYETPFASPGAKQSVTLPGVSNAMIAAISETGVRSAAASISGRASPRKTKPAPLDVPSDVGPGGEPPENDSIAVWAYPGTEKAHPVSGNLLEEVGSAAYGGKPAGRYRTSNPVWTGRGIRLFGARGEVLGFHLLIEARRGSLKNAVIQLPNQLESTLANADPCRPAISLFRDWYVKDGDWFPEVCVPLRNLDIPAADNAVPGQRNQSVFVDLLIPKQTPPGIYRGQVRVSAEGTGSVLVPITLTVTSLTLPDTLTFDISLNTYGTVGHLFGIDDRTPAYRALEREYHRLAHLHRATFAPLGYSHGGTFSTNYAPPLQGQGAAMRVSDWSAWDAQFGPYLDGSAFADLPRAGVPISHFYLPFHEAWPSDIRAHYHYRQTVTDYPALVVEHAMTAPPVEQAFDKTFGEEYAAVARQFAEHLKERGWTRTQYQVYQNDKNYYKDPKMGGRGTSWWLLDEPNFRDDWLALAYFSRLFRQGVQGITGVPLVLREDISRPQWQRDYLDGLVDLMVVSGELYEKQPLLRRMQERLGVRYWNYGTANAVKESNLEAEAWAVRAWLAGADGIVPWQTVGTDENYTKADDTALLLPGKRFGIAGPIASLRLKALRRAQQDAEYLVLLAKSKSWDRDQITAATADILNLHGAFEQAGADDAGHYTFQGLRAATFDNLRRAIAAAVQTRRQGDKETRRQGDKETRRSVQRLIRYWTSDIGHWTLSPCLPVCLTVLSSRRLHTARRR